MSITRELYPTALRYEYSGIVDRLNPDAGEEDIIAALIHEADWTELGAKQILHLAQQYGTSILRNALALAEAMEIEDGEAGF